VICFLQYFISITIEVANIGVLLMTTDAISMISNFVAIVIVAEFDNFVYQSMKDEPFKKLVTTQFTEEVFRIRHTSSKKCSELERSDERDEIGELRPLKVSWRKRSNKCAKVFYKANRVFYISFYFYFFPFIAMIINGCLPVFTRNIDIHCIKD